MSEKLLISLAADSDTPGSEIELLVSGTEEQVVTMITAAMGADEGLAALFINAIAGYVQVKEINAVDFCNRLREQLISMRKARESNIQDQPGG